MTAINEILNMQPKQYENMLFMAWLRWCESVTMTQNDLQKVLSDPSINKWYNMEYAKCENDFMRKVSLIDGTLSVSIRELKKCYADCTYRMFSIAPRALIADLKKVPSLHLQEFVSDEIDELTINFN